MSWFTLMEMALVAIMTVYLTYHTHLVFRPVREAKLITFLIIVVLIFLCQISMNVFGIDGNQQNFHKKLSRLPCGNSLHGPQGGGCQNLNLDYTTAGREGQAGKRTRAPCGRQGPVIK